MEYPTLTNENIQQVYLSIQNNINPTGDFWNLKFTAHNLTSNDMFKIGKLEVLTIPVIPQVSTMTARPQATPNQSQSRSNQKNLK